MGDFIFKTRNFGLAVSGFFHNKQRQFRNFWMDSVLDRSQALWGRGCEAAVPEH